VSLALIPERAKRVKGKLASNGFAERVVESRAAFLPRTRGWRLVKLPVSISLCKTLAVNARGSSMPRDKKPLKCTRQFEISSSSATISGRRRRGCPGRVPSSPGHRSRPASAVGRPRLATSGILSTVASSTNNTACGAYISTSCANTLTTFSSCFASQLTLFCTGRRYRSAYIERGKVPARASRSGP